MAVRGSAQDSTQLREGESPEEFQLPVLPDGRSAGPGQKQYPTLRGGQHSALDRAGQVLQEIPVHSLLLYCYYVLFCLHVSLFTIYTRANIYSKTLPFYICTKTSQIVQ